MHLFVSIANQYDDTLYKYTCNKSVLLPERHSGSSRCYGIQQNREYNNSRLDESSFEQAAFSRYGFAK